MSNFTWSGFWNSGTTYQTNTFVTYENVVYVSLNPNISSTPSSGNTDWDIVVYGEGSTYIERTPLPTVTPTQTTTPGATPTTTPTVTQTITQTPSHTPISTQTPTPSVTAQVTNTPTITPTQTQTGTPDITTTPTTTPTVTQTSTQTPTPSVTAQVTNTPTPTVTQTPTNTYTPTPSVTASQTQTPTPSITASQTQTPTPSITASQTQTPTPSITASQTQTPTPSITASQTQTPTVTTTRTQTPTPTKTQTPTPTRTAFLYYRWNITATKTTPPDANAVQASEFVFQIGGVDQSMSGVTVTNPGGNNPVGETPPNLVDGLLTTKCLDGNFISNGHTYFVFQFSSAKAFTGYRWATANDFESRDPASWTVQGSNDNSNWTTLSTVSGFSATAARQTYQTPQTY